jgi:hypothetical protein
VGRFLLEVSVEKATKPAGRPTVFPKDGPDVHGRISEAAGKKFEMYRQRLAKLAKWEGSRLPGDGDVIEFIIRGEVSTRLKLKGEI